MVQVTQSQTGGRLFLGPKAELVKGSSNRAHSTGKSLITCMDQRRLAEHGDICAWERYAQEEGRKCHRENEKRKKRIQLRNSELRGRGDTALQFNTTQGKVKPQSSETNSLLWQEQLGAYAIHFHQGKDRKLRQIAEPASCLCPWCGFSRLQSEVFP